MKLVQTISTLTAAVILSAGAVLRADTIKLTYTSGYAQFNGGGEFTLINSHLSLAGYNAENIVNGGFESFCISETEDAVLGGIYNYSLSDFVPPANHQLTEGAAWLYWEFATGNLAGYHYTPGAQRASDATVLQNAMWMFQGDIPFNAGNTFVALADSSILGGQAAAQGAESATLEKTVKVLLLNGPLPHNQVGLAQPQLYIQVPDSSTTIGLLGAGLVCLIGFRQFRRPTAKRAA